MKTFYLGVDQPRWLESTQSPNVPLFISYHRLSKYRRRGDFFPKGLRRWAMDSGAFSELDRNHGWSVPPRRVRRSRLPVHRGHRHTTGLRLPQDWMCEPHMLAKTGLTIADHQAFTIDSVQYLREEFPHAPWIPVLQDWRLQDYLAHVQQYTDAGIDLTTERLVGLGSVCRRQSTGEIGVIVSVLHSMGIRLHGFGVKCAGLARYGLTVVSGTAYAWSYGARTRNIRLDGCTHARCNNCLRYGLRWHRRAVQSLHRATQDPLALDFTNGTDFRTHVPTPRTRPAPLDRQDRLDDAQPSLWDAT